MKKDFLVPVMLCASFTCQANDYFFQPVISSSERYTSNLLLRPTSTGNWISKLSPGLNAGLRTENVDLKSNFTWNQLFYTNDTALNISEQLFNVDYAHRRGRLQWGLDGYFNNQSSLNSLSTVQGFTSTQVMAKQINIAPTVSYYLNELSSLSLNYSYSNTNYDKNSNPYLTNYDYQQVLSTYKQLYTEQDTLNATLSGSRYKNSAQGRTMFNEVGQLGWQHSFSEQLVSFVSAGINYSQTEVITFPFGTRGGITFYIDPATGRLTPIQPITNTNGMGGVFQASIQKSFEKGSVSLVGSQNQTPTNQGLQTQTQLTINTTYNIYERLTSGLSTSYSIYKMPVQQNTQFTNDRTLASVNPNINWKWTPEINVGLSYSYRQQDYKSSHQASVDNGVQLQLTYQPQTNDQVK
jgi:hypothetical protein